MATVTLSTFGNYVAGTTGFENGGVLVRLGPDTDTLNFPAAAPVGYKTKVVQSGAGTVTLAASTGATITGNTTIVATTVGVDVVNAGTATAAAWIATTYE